MNKTLYWFSNDLRLKENEALKYAAHNSDEIAFVYVHDTRLTSPSNFTCKLQGPRQTAYIVEAIKELKNALKSNGHQLIVIEGEPEYLIPELARKLKVTHLLVAEQIGEYERRIHQAIMTKLVNVSVETFWQHTLFTHTQVNELNFEIASFSKFRNKVEKKLPQIRSFNDSDTLVLPAPFSMLTTDAIKTFIKANTAENLDFKSDNVVEYPFFAGEHAAKYHLVNYFNSDAPACYKQTRNELDGWTNTTKFSPLLAIGNLSPKQIWLAVEAYEQTNVKNESTYWIKFELLWREYFQWLALKLGSKLYQFKGLSQTKPLTSFFPERFQKWCLGVTPYPLVNALMRELNQTGYMSNRGRQIVASCLINELGVDWRYGAAYFQQQLIDFDVASNWGNWQYIAGVGVDPRGGRHFNIEKQAQLYDASGVFINKWQGEQALQPIDSVDCADWPVSKSMQLSCL